MCTRLARTLSREHSMPRLIALTMLVLLACRPAYAYLDPGTGSLLIQGVLATLAAASAAIAAFWSQIRGFLRRRRRPKAEGEDRDGDAHGS
jgi:hypothetical protein